MKRLAIIGSRDLARQISYHIENDKKFLVVGYFDDFIPAGTLIENRKILGKTTDIEKSFENGEFDYIINGIGYNFMEFRNEIYERLKRIVPFATYIHSSNIIDPSAIIKSGSVLFAGTNLDMNVEIGENTLIYNGCVIAHDTKIGSNCILSPAVRIAGFCSVANSCILGIGTILSDSISLIENTKTGAGAVVVKSTHEAGLYVGIPAKQVKP
jgi:sugar O-acyltransferase (sialic acid O-acetyltransferase NeuD family)